MPPPVDTMPGAACERIPSSGSDLQATMACRASPGFAWQVLPRHGKRPLAIHARALLQADNRCAGLTIWSAIALHETSCGRFAASLTHVARYDAGLTWCDAWFDDSLVPLAQRIFDHDPWHRLPAAAFGRAGRDAAPWPSAWFGLLAACLGQACRPGNPP